MLSTVLLNIIPEEQEKLNLTSRAKIAPKVGGEEGGGEGVGWGGTGWGGTGWGGEKNNRKSAQDWEREAVGRGEQREIGPRLGKGGSGEGRTMGDRPKFAAKVHGEGDQRDRGKECREGVWQQAVGDWPSLVPKWRLVGGGRSVCLHPGPGLMEHMAGCE